MMPLERKLSNRIYLDEVKQLIDYIKQDNTLRDKLFSLLDHADPLVASQAAWVLSYWPRKDQAWLVEKQHALMDKVLDCSHDGKVRLLLSMLCRQPLVEKDRGDVLDYCMETILAQSRPVAIRSFCIKLAYRFCRDFPELLQELKETLDIIKEDASPGIISARKNILQLIHSTERKRRGNIGK